ncbi:MAG: OmpH/Skp family outer membrane protein [Planctomycetota bacterium]|jgi:Skp family chaperone for outer membrane proteins
MTSFADPSPRNRSVREGARRRSAPGLLLVAALLALPLAGVFDLGLSARSSNEIPPARVCMVDVIRVFDNAPQLAQIEASLNERQDELQALAESLRAELKRIEGELGLLQKGHPEYLAKERELNAKQADFRFQSEQWKEELERRFVDARDGLLAQIRAVVQTVCDQEGFDIVVQRDFRLPETPVVWSVGFYVRPEYDITDRVIAALE